MEKAENPNNQIKPYEQALCRRWGAEGRKTGQRHFAEKKAKINNNQWLLKCVHMNSLAFTR